VGVQVKGAAKCQKKTFGLADMQELTGNAGESESPDFFPPRLQALLTKRATNYQRASNYKR